MKKTLAVLIVAALALSLAACGGNTKKPDAPTSPAVPATDNAVSSDPAEVMSYLEYRQAAIDTPVCVETYVQAKEGWWEKNGVGVATFYTQAEEGAYLLYEMPCSQEDYDKLIPGTKLLIKGYKSDFHGEIEITDATFEILEAEPFIAQPVIATQILGDEDSMLNIQNYLAAFKGLKIAGKTDAEGNEVAFLYKYDGSGSEGDDLYFDVTDGTNVYTFAVESYLCGIDTEVYKTVKALKVGDTVDIEGFVYWYEGAQPHVTSVTVL